MGAAMAAHSDGKVVLCPPTLCYNAKKSMIFTFSFQRHQLSFFFLSREQANELTNYCSRDTKRSSEKKKKRKKKQQNFTTSAIKASSFLRNKIGKKK